MSIQTQSSYFADEGASVSYFAAEGATNLRLEDAGATDTYFAEFDLVIYNPADVTEGYMTSETKYYAVKIYA